MGGVKMSVFKITKNNNYTVMSNYHLRDKNLSYKAKGLLSFMLSLPDNWDYSMRGLEKISKENIKAIAKWYKHRRDSNSKKKRMYRRKQKNIKTKSTAI